eukprot:5254154-Amphidinium_carterae.1
MPILLFSIYLPIAASNIEDKQESYDRIQLILSNNPGAIPILLGDFNTRIINNFGLEHHVGAQFFPSAYSLEDAPQDVMESRDLLMEFLVETNSRIINTMHNNYFQNATFKAPAAEHFVPPFVPPHFAQLDYIITKS